MAYMVRTIALACGLAAILALPAFSGAGAQSTGSRINSAPPFPMARIRFDEPSELGKIRKALADGEIDKARRIANDFLASDLAPEMRYAGLNALCAVESSARNWSAALAACNEAIRIRPNHWMALNTRGTVYYLSGDVDKARSDFRKAYELVPEKGGNRDVVRHNLALVGVTVGDGGNS
ncbi:MAG: tetratricopeptide repeat protein [Alphaproteobacteria bacterium]|nr:MAG: tetratricopeptide repeat protein [Alphaproteobacteria bacterium]